MMGTEVTQLGKLEPVPLESIWPHEAHNFTPWLATVENLRILGDTLGLDLECEGQEVAVGSFAADIQCKDTTDGSWVLIENQIKKTDSFPCRCRCSLLNSLI